MKMHATQEVVVGMQDGTSVTVRAGDIYDSRSQVVKEHAWLFEASEDRAAK